MSKMRPLTDEQLRELLPLLHGADSTELKLTVPESDRYATVRSLDLDPLEARMRQVFFFDTPDLALNAAGVVVRARRIQDSAADTVIKLRPVRPDDLPEDLRRDDSFTVEVDAMPGGFVCSASFKGTSNNESVRAAARGEVPLRKLYSKRQRAFFRDHAPDGVDLDGLAMLGPIPVMKLKKLPTGLDRKIAVELWNYPDGSRILELSTKCAPEEAFQVAAEVRAYLTGLGIDLGAEQQTKTATALTYFAKQLKGT